MKPYRMLLVFCAACTALFLSLPASSEAQGASGGGDAPKVGEAEGTDQDGDSDSNPGNLDAGDLLSVEMRLVSMPESLIDDLCGEAPVSGDDVYSDEAVVMQVMEALEKGEGSQTLSTTRLSFHSEEWGGFSNYREHSYVSGHSVKDGVGEPIRKVVRDGVAIDLCPILSIDGRYVSLATVVSSSELVLPMQSHQIVQEGLDRPALIEIPEIESEVIRHTATINLGGTLIVRGIRHVSLPENGTEGEGSETSAQAVLLIIKCARKQ